SRTAGSVAGAYTIPDPWTAIGPKNLGGRTIALAFNPLNTEIIYAGGASGGLWRTDSGGTGASAWRYIDTGEPVLGVHSIAVDPADTSVVYIGTGEVYNRAESMGSIYIRTTRGSYGIGLLKSTDSGQTWTKSIDWSYDERRGVHDIVIDPHDHTRIWAGTSEGVYRTVNAGASWIPVLDVQMAVDIAVNPDHSDTLYASCGNLDTPSGGGIGIYRSYDGGDSWTKLNESDGVLPLTWTGKTMLDIYQAAPNVIYADVANMFSDTDSTGVALYRSLDHGDTWERLTWNNARYNSTTFQYEYCCFDTLYYNNLAPHGYHQISKYQGWFSHFVIVHPTDSSKVIVAGVDAYRSTDGGRSFDRITKWNDWRRGWVAAGDPDEGLSEHYSHADHHAFARKPYSPSSFIWGNDGGVFSTNNFGDSFSAHNGGYQTAQFYYGFSSSPITADLAIGGLQDNSTVLYVGTTDWKRIFGGDGGATALHATDPYYVIGSSQRGAIYQSFNRGDSRTFTSSNAYYDGTSVCFIAPIAQAPSDPSILYTGRTRVYKAINYAQGSNSWFLPPGADELSGAPVVSISVSASDPSVLWAGTVPDAPIRAGVFRSENGGLGWTDVTGNLPDRYPMDIVTAHWDHDVAFVTLSGFGTPHLYRTTDGGASWDSLGVGQLPDIPTSAFVIDPYDRDHFYLGTDFGVWFSPDAGVTWEPFATGMPTAAQILDLSISPVNWSIRAVTHGTGVWERPLVSAAEIESDALPPRFDFGLHRNSVLPDYLDLYFVPSEVLPLMPVATINSVALPLTTISTSEGNIYQADYKIQAPGTHAVAVQASDYAGNDSTSVFNFEAQLLGGTMATALASADGTLLLALPSGTLGTPEYVVARRLDVDPSTIGMSLLKISDRDGITRQSFEADEEVLAIWSLLPGERLLSREARLLLTWDQTELGTRPASSLIIERRTGEGWEPLSSYVDESRHRVEASITRLGIYRLRSTSDAGALVPYTTGLGQNYPNPFNGSTMIRYSLARSARVELHILNTRGQRVRTLVEGTEGPGAHVVTWQGRDNGGREVATGVYLITLHVDGVMFTRKALYIR
ncbi:FlgD immunoglobulin-like domain containing protein, partial [Gemmatimonadota bacterium]